MRLVGNARQRRFRWARMPLELAPGRQLWEAHRDQEYLVYVDESFYRFFGFEAVDGNFCYAAVGVPSRNYQQLQRLFQPTIVAYRGHLRRLACAVPDEIKFSILRLLPRAFRVRFARDLVRSLVETGGFVSGFYTPTHGHVMERVRTNLDEDIDAVPEDHEALYNVARAELLAQRQAPGQQTLLTSLLTLPIAAVTNLLKSFNCRFRIIYDPREDVEDEAVRTRIADYMDRLMRLPPPFAHDNNYIGMEIDRTSEQELGLQLADVVAGEVRDFFRSNDLPLTESTTPRIIDPTSDERLQQFEQMEGHLFKSGSLVPMSRELRRMFLPRNTRHIVSYYYPVLASGMLTCVTLNGQERHLELSTRTIFDLLD